MRGIKRIEFRSRPTSIIGERFYIYASRQWAVGKLLLAGCGGISVFDPEAQTRRQIPSTKSQSNPNDQIPSAAGLHVPIVGDNIEVPAAMPEPWMMELAKMLILKDLPMGVIVGSAVIEKCERMEDGGSKMEDSAGTSAPSSILYPPSSSGAILNPPSSLFCWHLADVQRAKKFRKPKGHPQPVWFTPF
jgi:hypothetical protein